MFAKKSIIAVLMMSLSMPIYSRIVADDVIKDVKQQYAPDTRVAVWSVTADKQSGNSVVLRGKTDNPDAKDALLRGLKAVNIAYKDSITLLPDATVEKPWALVTISVACLRGEPRSGAELVSQAIMGTPVKVLECDGGMARVQTPDGYIAYVTDSSLQFLSADGFAAWKKARRVVVTANLSMAYEKPARRAYLNPALSAAPLPLFVFRSRITGRSGRLPRICTVSSVQPSQTTMTSLHCARERDTMSATVPALLYVGIITQMPLSLRSCLLSTLSIHQSSMRHVSDSLAYRESAGPMLTCPFTLPSSSTTLPREHSITVTSSGEITRRNFMLLAHSRDRVCPLFFPSSSTAICIIHTPGVMGSPGKCALYMKCCGFSSTV